MRLPASHSRRTALLGAVVFLVLVLAPPASAATLTITKTPDNPVVGESITFDSNATSDCALTYTWTIDGVDQAPSGTRTLTTSFATAGSHTVALKAEVTAPPCGSPQLDTGTTNVEVLEGLNGSISVSPDPPYTNEPITLTAGQTGGFGPPFEYAWDTDDDGSFDDGTDLTATPTYTADGAQVVKVRIRDSATPVHETVVTRTLNLGPRPADVPRPPPPPPCVKRLAFGLSEFTTGGCFTTTAFQPKQWETTAAIKLNGLSLPAYGQKFVITEPTAAEPGGHLSATRAAIQVGKLTVFSGDIDWELPGGEPGGEEVVRSLSVPSFARLFGLKVLGSIDLKLGQSSSGKHYATLPLNVEFPSTFRAGPGREAGTVTGDAALKVDEDGVRYDGLKITASDVWLGRIKVVETCFSFVPSGGQSVDACEAPSLDGKPYITCATDSETDRWDGNAVIELPTANQTRLAAFGGLADGRVSKLGGFVDNLGTTLPIVPGVYLNRVGVGLCLSPPPFKIRGDVGVSALPTPAGATLGVNGRFLYTDAYDGKPWSLEVGGNVNVFSTQVGEGSLTFNAWGDIDFGLSAEMDLFGVASLNGEVAGWVEPRNDTFNVEGSLEGCLASVICARALGLISSTGVAGCVDAGTIEVPVPYNARQGPFGFGSVSFSVRTVSYPLKAGFGHRFGSGKVDLLGNSCDFSAYEAAKSEDARAAQGPGGRLSERIAPGTKAVSLRIRGSRGAPKVVVRGPNGATITSPKSKRAKQRKGKYLIVENQKQKTTSVLLVKPAAGTWTIKAAPRARSRPTRVDRSNFEAPQALFGQVRWSKPWHREVALAYAVPPGAKVQLVERSRKGIGRTLVKSVRGRPCKGARPLPGGRRLLCLRKKFRVARGPGGDRTVQAVVTRGGIPLTRKNVARFQAPRQPLPARPGALSARRRGADLIVVFPRSAGASRYSVTAVLGDGRRLGYDLAGRCRAVRIPRVAKGVSAAVKVAGVRYDVKLGRYRGVKLPAGRNAAGRSVRLPKKICR